MTGRWANIVNVSGGKDSTAIYLLALERGLPFSAVFADTGNEHPWTYDFVRELPNRMGGPSIQWVKADFTAAIERKRRFIASKWLEGGVPASRVERALSLLHPTGNPFLDLCLLKGRFPSTRARFCTQELKIRPIEDDVLVPTLSTGRKVVSWQGVRAEESAARALLPKLQRLNHPAGPLFAWRPIHQWPVDAVWEMHKRHGLKPNPLYAAGMNRVGCMPCIMSRKDEIRRMADRFPAEVERLSEWEALVGEVSKRGRSSFFSHDKTPGAHQGRSDIAMPGIREVVDWSRTSRGGRQYDGLALMLDAGTACNEWGACE